MTFDRPSGEPLFMAIPSDGPEYKRAFRQAAESIDVFRRHVLRDGDHTCMAKLRFRDPDESDRRGEDVLLYLWLTSVQYNEAERIFVGRFFEVPDALTKWHRVGQTLGFEADDVFDWMVLDEGRLFGGYTIRVARAHVEEKRRAEYDEYIGVKHYEPVD